MNGVNVPAGLAVREGRQRHHHDRVLALEMGDELLVLQVRHQDTTYLKHRDG